MNAPTFGSLFAGIGGIDLGLERAGWRGRWQVEYEPFCQRVLAKHWPDVTRYGNIHDMDWGTVEPVDLVAGGFPCQPWSNAGQRKGLADDRWLWPEFARCIRDLRPRYVLVENVPGLLVGGGIDAVLGGLAELGYDTEWESIPASAVGAPHLRYRVWIVAYASGVGPRRQAEVGQASLTGSRPQGAGTEPDGAGHRAMADSNGALGQRGRLPSGIHSEYADPDLTSPFAYVADSERGRQSRPGEPLDAQYPEAAADWEATEPLDGRLTHEWSTEPDVGRVAHGVPARVDRLRALGNAVVPQVVEWIGRRIIEAEGLT